LGCAPKLAEIQVAASGKVDHAATCDARVILPSSACSSKDDSW
jgi:hypothetical protein